MLLNGFYKYAELTIPNFSSINLYQKVQPPRPAKNFYIFKHAGLLLSLNEPVEALWEIIFTTIQCHYYIDSVYCGITFHF